MSISQNKKYEKVHILTHESVDEKYSFFRFTILPNLRFKKKLVKWVSKDKIINTIFFSHFHPTFLSKGWNLWARVKNYPPHFISLTKQWKNLIFLLIYFPPLFTPTEHSVRQFDCHYQINPSFWRTRKANLKWLLGTLNDCWDLIFLTNK